MDPLTPNETETQRKINYYTERVRLLTRELRLCATDAYRQQVASQLEYMKKQLEICEQMAQEGQDEPDRVGWNDGHTSR
jgi:hypothetical protein